MRKTSFINNSKCIEWGLNISQGAISHYELGRRDVDLSTCRKITKFFVVKGINVSIDDVFPPKNND